MARFWTGLLVVLALGAAPGWAEGRRTALGVGNLGIFGPTDEFEVAVSAALEGSEMRDWWGIRPLAEVIYQPDDTYYVGVGGLLDYALRERWSWGVGAAAGYYHRGDEGKDLGHRLEFHTRIFLAYLFAAGSTLRAELGHISNAELDDVNPGTEYFGLSWVFPF